MPFLYPQELEMLDRLPERPVVLDVGANIGAFTAAVLARRPEARVFAFEAQEDARRVFAGRFPAVPIWGALGAESGRREMWSDAEASELGTFHPRIVPPIVLESRGEVTVWPLATLWPELEVERADLLKIDVEGGELDVLRGALPILSRIGTIYWENTVGANAYTRHTLRDFRELLTDFDVVQMKPAQDDDLELLVAKPKEKQHA